MEKGVEISNQSLSCLTYLDESTGVFISHCLNYDLMDCGPTCDVAWQNLKIVMKNHIEFCYTNYPEGLMRKPARREKWDIFFNALRANPKDLIVEKMELELKPPSLPERELEFWIQRVQSGRDCADVQAGQGTVQAH